MTLSELNSLGKRLEKLSATLEPEQEITFVCCWGDEDIPTDSNTVEVKTLWSGGRLEDDQDQLELEDF